MSDTYRSPLPTDSEERKRVPLARGVLDYFPAALAEVARVSKAGNDKHNPGQPMHHARGKSSDHVDSIMRHLVDRGTVDPSDGQRHSAHLAWRALALLQEELEAAGAPLARGARLPEAPALKACAVQPPAPCGGEVQAPANRQTESLRDCASCRYGKQPPYEYPCLECFGAANHHCWEPVQAITSAEPTPAGSPEHAPRSLDDAPHREPKLAPPEAPPRSVALRACRTCLHVTKPVTAEPCDHCGDHDCWAADPEIAGSQTRDRGGCRTCLHETKWGGAEPCSRCFSQEHWEPKP